MAAPLRIGITSGDPDGIGTEVVSKALRKLGPQKGVRFYLWRSPDCPARHLKRIDQKFSRTTVNAWSQVHEREAEGSQSLIDICSHQPAARWVESAAEACLFRKLDAMVTGPLSKTSIIDSGLSDIGHTSILKRVSETQDVFMGFFGSYFNVGLVTDHVPLAEVSSTLTEDKLEKAVVQFARFVGDLKLKKPIAVLGLNPHAGESGLLGKEESSIVTPVLDRLKKQGLNVVGPLVPDAAFFKANWEHYSLYLALYHDQGLIPFKAFHGQKSGVHISVGLPFIRTSVDHGTAKDIFGKEVADERSMIDAVDWSIRMARARASNKGRSQ